MSSTLSSTISVLTAKEHISQWFDQCKNADKLKQLLNPNYAFEIGSDFPHQHFEATGIVHAYLALNTEDGDAQLSLNFIRRKQDQKVAEGDEDGIIIYSAPYVKNVLTGHLGLLENRLFAQEMIDNWAKHYEKHINKTANSEDGFTQVFDIDNFSLRPHHEAGTFYTFFGLRFLAETEKKLDLIFYNKDTEDVVYPPDGSVTDFTTPRPPFGGNAQQNYGLRAAQ